MEWNVFDEWIDTLLYRQMKDLIYVACSKENKYELNRENRKFELFEDATEKTIEEEYGLHYPGEVLERLGEHRVITEKQIRALGLALAKTKNLQEDQMFIGNQLPVFMKKLNGLPDHRDPFVLGIRYLLDEKTKKQSYEKFISYAFEEIEEILFALSILPKDDGLWKKAQGKLNAKLGKERKISVYENSKVYVWLAQNFQFRMKGYRKKDMDALKYLMRLPFGSASGNGKIVRNKLLENGYCGEEISFLNYVMIQEVRLAGSVCPSSITGEKMAIEVCRNFLDSKEEYPKQAYELCGQLCAFHKSFQIKVNGHDGIAEALRNIVEVKNVKAFQVLYPYSDKVKKWRRIDLTDNGWDVLYTWLPEEEYDVCVAETLEAEMDAAKMSDGLKHYQDLTGKEYIKRFWENTNCAGRNVFNHLAEYGALPVVSLMEQFLKEYREDMETAKGKWKNLVWYLQRYMEGIRAYETYAMLELFVEEFGIKDLDGMFSVTELLKSCFTEDYSSSYYYRRQKKLDLFRPFLEAEEHRKLFSWIDEYIFREHTDEYFKFLIHVLSKEDNFLWFPKEEAREIFLCLQESEGAGDIPGRLRGIYLTESEQEELKNREKFLEERRALKQKMDEIRTMKAAFTKMVAKSRLKAGQFKEITNFINRYYYSIKKEVANTAASYIRSLLEKEIVHLYRAGDLEALFSLLSLLYGEGALDLGQIKQFVIKMEELWNENKDIEACADSQ